MKWMKTNAQDFIFSLLVDDNVATYIYPPTYYTTFYPSPPALGAALPNNAK